MRMLDTLNYEIGQRILAIRTQKNWSRKFLADKAGITSQFLLLVEKGERGLSSHSIRGLALALVQPADQRNATKGRKNKERLRPRLFKDNARSGLLPRLGGGDAEPSSQLL